MAKAERSSLANLATTILECLYIAKAFRIETEQMIERCISYGADPNDHSPIDIENPRSYPKNEVWRHTQTVVHFNAGQAFEGFLKLLLMVETCTVTVKVTHKLLDIYSELSPNLQHELSEEWHKMLGNVPMQQIAYIHANTKPEAPPSDRYALDFRHFLMLLDESVKWYIKRYSWQKPSQWNHFIVDLRPHLRYLDKVEEIAIDLARNRSYLHPPELLPRNSGADA